MVWVWHKGGVGGPWFDDRRRVAGAGSGGIGGVEGKYAKCRQLFKLVPVGGGFTGACGEWMGSVSLQKAVRAILFICILNGR